MFVVMAASGEWWWFEGPMTDGDWALAAAAGVTALVFYLMVEIIRLAGPVFFTTVNFMIPLTGIGWGVLLRRARLHQLGMGNLAEVVGQIAIHNFVVFPIQEAMHAPYCIVGAPFRPIGVLFRL